MHKMRINELTLEGLIEPDGPILIKSGVESGADPTLPSMNFVRTRHPREGAPTIYLPGASLKGVLRSHVERIVRTVHGADPKWCCDPLGDDSCGKRLENENKRAALTTSEEYRRLCLACRIFGHMAHASHFSAADAYPEKAINALPVRQGVAINRFSGGVGVGPFEMEVATAGRFGLRLMLVNFEIWQVGLLALALRDLAEGRLLIGFGKSRGLGKVSLALKRLEIGYPGRFGDFDPTTHLYGVGALVDKETAGKYGFVPGDRLALSGGKLAGDSALWGRPAVSFGLEPGEQDSQAEALERANQAIFAALARTVPAWAGYRKAEASHAGG